MTIRWGLLGCGDIARKRVARAIIDAPGSQLVAACRREERQLYEFCRQFQVPRAFTCAADLLCDPDIDAVYIATPVHLHLPHTLAAAAAGKHVLVEKPMARTVAECDQMIAACRQHGVQLGVAYYRRFYPIVRRIKELLASGEIGKPLAVSAVTATAFNLRPGADGYWRVLPEEGGGGALMDIGSHRLNLFLDLFGDVAEVKSVCSTVAGAYAAEDVASLVLRFASGVHGSLQCFFGAATDPDEFAVMGTAGRLVARPLNGSTLQIDLASGSRRETHPPPDNLHAPLVADFVAALREGRPPLVTGEEGRRTNEVMARAYRPL
jgi:predicted dehydrogenase